MPVATAFRLTDRFADLKSSPVRDIQSVLGRPGMISFAGGIPDATLFAKADFAACFDHVLTHQAQRALQYSNSRGEPELLAALAARMGRQLPTTPEDLLVTTGSQEGIYLVALTTLDPGDVVLVERPTYLAAIQAFGAVGARMVEVETDGHGMLPDALDAAIAAHRPRLVYLVPTFQNPTGRSMPASRREEVAAVLRRTGTPLLEDDPYGELRYEGAAAAPIASLDGMAAQTVLLNTASKTMAPGVRIGWMRAEGPLLRAVEIAKGAIALHSPVTDQLAIAHYLTHFDLDAHVAGVIRVYRERRDAMADGLARVLPAGARANRPEGGMFFWVDLGDGSDTATRLGPAVDAGVAFVPGGAFYASDPNRSAMRLSFVTNSPAVIEEGLDRLAGVLGW